MTPELLFATTDDGWRLALHHFPPAGPIKRHYPVLLLHGLAANHINFDLDGRHSLARAMQARGYEVFIAELRGSGHSKPPDTYRGNEPHAALPMGDLGPDEEAEREGRPRFVSWGFADYTDRDLPALARTVLAHSGAEKLHGVGHSMGGMALFCQATRAAENLQSITAVGSPCAAELNLGKREQRLLKFAAKLSPAMVNRRLPIRSLMGAASYLIPWGARLVDGLLINGANTDRGVITRMATEGLTDVPLRLLLELAQSLAGDRDGPFAYERDLAQIDLPILVIGGSVDRVAPLSSIRALVRRLNPRDLRYREMGKAYGDGADYGHVDLLIGRNSYDEVFVDILDFLADVDGTIDSAPPSADHGPARPADADG